MVAGLIVLALEETIKAATVLAVFPPAWEVNPQLPPNFFSINEGRPLLQPPHMRSRGSRSNKHILDIQLTLWVAHISFFELKIICYQ